MARQPQTSVPVSISSAGDNVVIAAQSGKFIEVMGLTLSLADETTVEFKSGAVSLSGPQTMLSMVLDDRGSAQGWYITGKGETFVISLGSAIQAGGTIWFRYI